MWKLSPLAINMQKLTLTDFLWTVQHWALYDFSASCFSFIAHYFNVNVVLSRNSKDLTVLYLPNTKLLQNKITEDGEIKVDATVL